MEIVQSPFAELPINERIIHEMRSALPFLMKASGDTTLLDGPSVIYLRFNKLDMCEMTFPQIDKTQCPWDGPYTTIDLMPLLDSSWSPHGLIIATCVNEGHPFKAVLAFADAERSSLLLLREIEQSLLH